MTVENDFRQLLISAISKRASDVYILPRGQHYLIKIRYQDQLEIYNLLSLESGKRLLNYCKFISNMAISEQRRPQLGSYEFNYNKNNYALRFSSVGNFNNQESLVIRIIYPLINSNTLFFNPSKFNYLDEVIQQRGLVLFAGPTGSGKTTTIYRLAKKYAEQKIIMSIEDPVEIKEPNFLQLQVNAEADMSYSELIKVGLRHRPDIFIVGEIRDESTAKATIKAALSGHLVLSTIHASDPIGVINRLKELGVSQNFINQSLNGIVYQRILPTLKDSIGKCMLVVHKFKELDHEQNYNWKDWQDELEILFENKQISEYTKQKFYWG